MKEFDELILNLLEQEIEKPLTLEIYNEVMKDLKVHREKKQYSEKYDAYYDSETNEWLEENCGDKNCEFCKNRPKKPLKEDEK